MEVARLFGVLPHTLLRLPSSEFRKLARYYKLVREQTESSEGGWKPESDATIVE